MTDSVLLLLLESDKKVVLVSPESDKKAVVSPEVTNGSTGTNKSTTAIKIKNLRIGFESVKSFNSFFPSYNLETAISYQNDKANQQIQAYAD